MYRLTRSRSAALWSTAAVFAGSLLIGVGAHAAPVSDSFGLYGLVDTQRTFDLGALQAFPNPLNPVTQTDNYTAGGSPTFTGVPLYTLLTDPTHGGGGILTSTGVKNETLGDAVLVTGSDGYTSVTSVGEIDPNFGNKQDLVAYQNAPGSNLTTDGFARTTAPGDVAGGRYVSNVTNLTVFSGTAASTIAAIGPTGTLSTSFALAGPAVVNPGTFNAASLSWMPQVSVTSGATTYNGVSLWSFLQSAGILISPPPTVKNDILNKYLVATGSDGYKVTIALGELSPMFGNQNDIIATSMTTGGVTTGLGSNGFARLILPGDNLHGRWVSNLIGLEVVSAPAAVPVPGAVVLFGTGIVALVGIARRNMKREV